MISFGNIAVRNSYKCIFQIFTTRLSLTLFNEYEIYGTTHEYICTYINTYRQTQLAFNTLMWGALRLAPIKFENVYSRTRSSEEGVRPTFQASSDRRLWRREDVRALQIRGRHFQHDLHINYR